MNVSENMNYIIDGQKVGCKKVKLHYFLFDYDHA